MKKIMIFALAIGLSVGAFAQKQNATITSAPVKVKTNVVKTNSYIYPFDEGCATIDSAKLYRATYNGSFIGWVTGQNFYGDIAFAQKYALSSSMSIKGIAAMMINYVDTPSSQANNVKLYNTDFSSTLATKAYNSQDITSDLGITEFMFASPVTAQNFACAVEVGEITFDADSNYNLVGIASTPAGCVGGDGENSYSYSAIDTNGNMGWITLQSGWNADFDLFIFPIVEGSGLNSADVNALSYVYPNPASDNVTIASSLTMNRVELYNVLGQKVYSVELNGISTNINTANLSKGTYAVKIYTESGVANKKLVIE